MTAASFPVPELIEQSERHLAVVRQRVAFDGIPALFDRAFPAIFGALGEAGLAPLDAPMGVTHGEPGAELDLSVAVPIAAPFTAHGEVTHELLPSGTGATLLVRGDYARLAAAYEHLFGWIADQGLTPRGVAWEQYLTEPEPGGDPALNETLIVVLVD